jgi:hypothetical protein
LKINLNINSEKWGFKIGTVCGGVLVEEGRGMKEITVKEYG